MKKIVVPQIRLDPQSVDAPTINRVIDNIVTKVNDLANTTANAVNALEASTSGVQDILGGVDIGVTSVDGVYTIDYTGSSSGVNINGGTGINVVEAPAGTFTITNTDPASNIDVLAGNGVSVAESPAGVFTVTNTGALLSGAPQTFNNSNTFNGAVTLGSGQTFTNNGTISGGIVNATTYQNLPVDDILAGPGIAVSESPAGTFTIVNTNQGGGGGGGQIFYLNGNIAGDAPIPIVGTTELGQTVQPTGSNSGPITLPNTNAYVAVGRFVTDLNVPDVLIIPAGIWDFNVFMSTNASQPDDVAARIRLYTWNGSLLTQIGISNPVYITDNTVTVQLILSVIVPETTVTATTRIYALLEAHVTKSNSHTATAYYGNTFPSHVHSTIPFAYVENILAGTAISVAESPTGTYTVTNTLPDQTVALTNGTGISVTGTYPNFTVTNTSPDQTVAIASGTAISVTGTYPSFNVTNTAPDQIVAMASGTGISVTGTYPNFTITNSDPGSGVNVTGGTGVTVTEPTPNNFSVAIGQAVGTTDSVTFNSVTGTSVSTPIVDTATAVPLNIGAVIATSVNIGKAGISTIINGTAVIGTVVPTTAFSVIPAAASGPTTVTITAGQNTAGVGSVLTLNAGQGSTDGGAASIGGGAGVTTGGATNITAGAAAAGGAISVTAGVGALSAGGTLTLKSGLSTANSGGEVIVQANTGNSVGFRGGHVQIAAGNSTSGTAGNVYVEGGDAATDGTINIGTGTGTSPLGSTSGVTIGRTAFNTTINGGVTTPVVVGTYAYAEGSTANVNITNTTAPATIVYSGVSQNGVSLNIATGNFTVPASGIYRIEFYGIMRAVTIPATTYWIAFELFDATASSVIYTTSCFLQRGVTGVSTAWATTDSYEFYMNQLSNLTAGSTYRIRARNNTAAGTFVAGFEPTLTNASTSRAGRRFKLSIERKT